MQTSSSSLSSSILVGSMHELIREDFNLISNEHDCGIKNDLYTSNMHMNLSPVTGKIESTKTPLLPSSSKGENLSSSTLDLFPTHATTWHQHPMNNAEHAHLRLDLNPTSKLLLQNSDDPMICSGANDAHDEDHPFEFRSLIAKQNSRGQQQTQQRDPQYTVPSRETPKSGCSTLTKQQLKMKASQMSALHKRRNIEHMPMLPHAKPAAVMATATDEPTPVKSKKRSSYKLRFHHQAVPPEYAKHNQTSSGQEGRRPATKTITRNVNTAVPPPTKKSHESIKSWLQKITKIQREADQAQQQQEQQMKASDINNNVKPITQRDSQAEVDVVSRPIVGKVLPKSFEQLSLHTKYNDLPYMGEMTLNNSKPRRGRKPKKADICHLIYKNYGKIVTNGGLSSTTPTATTKSQRKALYHQATVEDDEEPLNLCLRDQSCDSYSTSSIESVQLIGDYTKADTPATTTNESLLEKSLSAPKLSEQPAQIGEDSSSASMPTNLLHPVTAAYYQRLLESGAFLQQQHGMETIERGNQLALKIPIPSNFFKTPAFQNSSNKIAAIPAAKNLNCSGFNSNVSSSSSSILPQKRKRSAIYIPPMPAENSNSPTTEVSICKFKFTGGPKPMLQEKKMLSVDAEGNYRYFNGAEQTKALRNHETPYELPNYNDLDKIFIDIAPPSAGLSHELLQIPPVSPTSALLLGSGNGNSATSNVPTTPSILSASPVSSHSMHEQDLVLPSTHDNDASISFKRAQRAEHDRKRRSSRRSLQREKLEKTFKEKGFLIKTQQLESAEGATYCKFRQLKKFTRYLFRNWKDYLPENVDLNKQQQKQMSDDKQQEGVVENLLLHNSKNFNGNNSRDGI